MMCWKAISAEALWRRMRRNEKGAGTSCGTYGWEKIPRFLERIRWLPLNGIFWKMRKAIKKRKIPITGCLKEKTVDMILGEFGLGGEESHIINGHVPVKSKNGENPVKCGGKVLVIDGGFSRAYQKETGIAGYTLIYNSYGLILAAHEPFESRAAAIEQESDIYSEDIIVKRTASRKLVGGTDTGQQLKKKSQIWNSC